MSQFNGLQLSQTIQRRFEARATYSSAKLEVLQNKLAKAHHPHFFEHLTIYTAGSYGRLEASKYSDIDLFFVLAIRRELEQSAFGIVILTAENIDSTWLHFEAGAIAKSVEEGRVVPILFGLKHSDVQQPLSMFQSALFEKEDIFRVVKSINGAAGADAREERQLETVFDSFWPRLDEAIKPKLAKLRTTLPRHQQNKMEHDRILEELLLLGRQQSRILANPAGLVGEEILALLLRLTHEPDGAAVRLVHKERDLVLALCGRWGKLEHELNGYLNLLDAREKRHAREMIERFSMYMKELQAVLTGTATPQSIIQAFGSGLVSR